MGLLPNVRTSQPGGNHGSEREQWYLLRENITIDGVVYEAGKPVLKTSDGWRVGNKDVPSSACLEAHVCNTEYAGLSLHSVSRDQDGTIWHKRLGSDESPEAIPASRLLHPPDVGCTKLYLAFGDQFYPLDYFGW